MILYNKMLHTSWTCHQRIVNEEIARLTERLGASRALADEYWSLACEAIGASLRLNDRE